MGDDGVVMHERKLWRLGYLLDHDVGSVWKKVKMTLFDDMSGAVNLMLVFG